MEGFLIDLGKTFVDKLINGAIEKSRYIFCFKCIAKEFEEEKIKLEAERKTDRTHKNKESSSYYLNVWERAHCLSRLSHILCNIKVIELWQLSKIKSVFTLSIVSKMSLETLTIKSCHELTHIIVDMGDESDDNGRRSNPGNVFPKLKELYIERCEKLEYIFGHINVSDDQNHNLQFPALEYLKLRYLRSFIDMCTKNNRITFHSTLTVLELVKCSQVDIKSIGDFIVSYSISRSQDTTTVKELSGNMEPYFIALDVLNVHDLKVESIFGLNEVNEQHMNVGLQEIQLYDMPFPKNYVSLENLTSIKIVQCNKLKIVFSTSIVRCLPHLIYLRIQSCKELKHVIEDDLKKQKLSNSLSSKTFFPKLRILAIENCNKLKIVFPVSICIELPELKTLLITKAKQLEEIFKSEGDQNVKIPNLKFVVFVKLPRLYHAQGNQFQDVNNILVKNCGKLSLTSALTTYNISDIDNIFYFGEDFELYTISRTLIQQFQQKSKGHGTSNKNPSEKTTKDFAISQEFVNEQSMDQQCFMNQQHSLGTIDSTIKPHGNNMEDSTLEITTAESLSIISEIKNEPPIHLVVPKQKLEGSASKKLAASTMSTISATKNEPPIQLVVPKQKGIEISVEEEITSTNPKTVTSSNDLELGVEEGATLTNAETITSSTHLELEYGDGQIAVPSFSISTTEPLTMEDVDLGDSMETTQNKSQAEIEVEGTSETRNKEDGDGQIDMMTYFPIANKKTNDQVKVSSTVEQPFPKMDEITISKSIPSSIAFQFPSIPFHIIEDLSSSLLITRELVQLVSKKHLDHDNLSLLTDFFVKHPSILLRDTSISNRYKGYAYNCLAELLKFLQTHSVLDVLGSSHSEFVELLQDMRKCGFDKDWLDGVENRALSPGLQVSQDALQKLLDSKHILTQHVEDLKHQLTSTESVLESIIQQEAQILETQAALSAPIGY